MADRKAFGNENQHQKRDYVVFFIVAFVLIFLTSSFVIENIYTVADQLDVSPVGIQAVYLSAIGSTTYEDDEAAEEVVESVQEEHTPDTTAKPTDSSAPTETTAQPDATVQQ